MIIFLCYKNNNCIADWTVNTEQQYSHTTSAPGPDVKSSSPVATQTRDVDQGMLQLHCAGISNIVTNFQVWKLAVTCLKWFSK